MTDENDLSDVVSGPKYISHNVHKGSVTSPIICECCKIPSLRIVAHHWFDTEQRCHVRKVCIYCNAKLRTQDDEGHAIPWKEQVRRAIVNGVITQDKFLNMMTEEYALAHPLIVKRVSRALGYNPWIESLPTREQRYKPYQLEMSL